MKKYTFSLFLFLLPIIIKAQFVVEGVLSKGIFKNATVFFEKNRSPTSSHISGMNTSVYIIYANGEKEEVFSDFLRYAEQFSFKNDTLSFIGTVLTGEKFYFLMTKNQNKKWEMINSGFIAGFDNLPQVHYTVKSLNTIDFYYVVINYNPQINLVNRLFYFNPNNSQVDKYEQTENDKITKQDTILKINGNSYKLVEAGYKILKYK